jgi:hypothetical protein
MKDNTFESVIESLNNQTSGIKDVVDLFSDTFENKPNS